MSTVFASPLATPLGAATATAGIAGAPIPGRSNQNNAHVNHIAWTFTIPASGAGSVAGDIIVVATMDVMGWLLDGYIINDAMGAGTTISAGRIDPNNSSNTSATRYLAATDTSVAGRILFAENMPEQVGTDPTGAVTDTGNTVPNFGQANIQISLTIGGTPTAGQVIKGVVWYTDRP